MRHLFLLEIETDLIVKDYNIPVDDGNISILARVYIPKHENDNETFPVVMDFHGNTSLIKFFAFINALSKEAACALAA